MYTFIEYDPISKNDNVITMHFFYLNGHAIESYMDGGACQNQIDKYHVERFSFLAIEKSELQNGLSRLIIKDQRPNETIEQALLRTHTRREVSVADPGNHYLVLI